MRKTFTLRKELIRLKIIVLILLTLCFKQSYSQQQFERVYANLAEQSNDEYLLLIKAGHVENKNNSVDGNTSTFATLNSTVVQLAFIKVGGEASLRLRFTGTDKPLPNTPVTIKLGIGGNLLSVLGGLTVQATNGAGNSSGNGNEVGPIYTGATLLNLLSGKNQVEFTITPTQAYDGVKIKLGNAGEILNAGVLTNIDIYHAYFLKPATNNIVCESVIDSLYGSTGILVGGLNPVSNPSAAFDKNDNTYSTLRSNVSALNSTFITGVYSSLSKPEDSIRLVLQRENTGLIDLDLISQINIQTFNNNNLAENITLSSPLLNLRLLGGSSSKYLLTLPTSIPFNRIKVSVGDGIAAVLNGLRVYEIGKLAPKPIITIPGLINGSLTACQGAAINFTINPAESNATYKWFDAPVNGNEITTDVTNNGISFSPKNLQPGTYNYYVAIYRNGCSDAASERARVTLIITPGATADDISASGTEICLGSIATIPAPTLSASSTIINPVFKWYFDAEKTTPIVTGVYDGATYTVNPNLSLSISNLTATRNLYISVSGNNICENPPGNLKIATVTVNNTPKPTIDLTGEQTIGIDGTITLTASAANATSFQWYKDGAIIAGENNNTFTITTATSLDAGTYSVIALGFGGCSSIVSDGVKINVGGFGSTKRVVGLVDGKINANSELTYIITVTNTGSTTLDDVSIEDVIPAGTTYVPNSADNSGTFDGTKVNWTVDVLPNTSVELGFKVLVNSDLTSIPSITNTASVDYPTNPDVPQTPKTPDIPTNQRKDFTSSKTIDGLAAGAKVKAGDILTYRIRVQNTGNIPLDKLSITDPIPYGTTYDIGSASNSGTFANDTLKWILVPIAFGGSTEVTFRVTVNNNLTGIPTIGNTATIIDEDNPDTPQTPTDPPRDTEPERKFTATKTIENGLNQNGKISPETELTFAITVTNTGNLDIGEIIITDPIPAGTTYVDGSADNSGQLVNGVLNWNLDLPFGATRTVKFKVDVVKDLTGIPSIRNIATVTDPQNPTTPENPTTPPIDTEPVRSFTSTKSVDGLNTNNKIDAGSELTYTIVVTNTGNIDLNNVSLEDIIPAGTTYIDGTANLGGTLTNNTLNWLINIPVSSNVTLTFKVLVTNDFTNITRIQNTAQVTDPDLPNGPLNPQNPTDGGNDTEQISDFTATSIITTTNIAAKAVAGDDLTVSITVKNDGNMALNNVIITNPLPNNTTYKSTGANGSFNFANSTVSFNVASIPVGSSETLTFVVTVNQDLVNVPSINNTANIKANGLDKDVSASIDAICSTTTVTDVKANGVTGGNICSTANNEVEIVATSSGVTSPVYYLYQNNSLVAQNNTGVFTLTLTAGNNYAYSVGISGTGYCQTLQADRKSISFTILESPSTPTVTTANVTICENTTATLSVSPVNPNYTYTWYLAATGGTAQGTGSTFTTPSISSNISYFVEATVGGCVSLTRTEVRITTIGLPAAPISVTSNGPICTGSATTLTVDNPVNGIIYRWYANLTGGTSLGEGNNFATGNLTANTTFYVESVNTSGCASSSRLAVVVNVLPLLQTPIVSLDAKTINSVSFKWNTVAGASSYEYSTDNGITWLSNGTNTTYTFSGLKPAQNVNITVRAISVNACQNSTASAVINDSSDNPLGNEVFIPNTFTPNNDGNNDFFLVYGNTIKSINMRIFNQWGQSIFQSQQINNGWNGTYRGQNQPNGVYIYSVELTFNDGTSTTKKGTITLIR